MTRRATGMPTLYVDFLLIAVLVLITLINPPTEADTATPPGNISIVAVWPEGSTDVDMWIMAPGQTKPTGYSNKGGKTVNLLRDDLGTTADSMPLNMEHAYTRGTPPGEYIINVHCYRCSGSVPVSVEVRKGDFGARQELLFQEAVELTNKQERTAVRFKLDGDGKVVPGSVNQVFQPLRAASVGGRR